MEKIIIYKGKETNYTVSEEGKIFNTKTKRELKGTLARNEYPSVQLRIDGKAISFMVHRLVAEAFCENPNGYTIVDHINRDKLDCRAENLRWVSAKENSKNATRKISSSDKEKMGVSEWKEISNYKGYVISRDGIVVNTKTNRKLIPSNRNGYLRVNLGTKKLSVHRLVYETYIGPISGYIDHINGDRSDNRVENLRDITQKENVKNTYERGRKNTISVKSYTSDGKLVKEYETMQAAAKDLGVTLCAIRAASLYGTKSGGLYWLRSDSITSSKEFNKKLGDDRKIFTSNSFIDNDGVIYSKTSKHCIPKFVDDENNSYIYLIQNGKYQKLKV